ncbi:hypothetical protein CHARACLAT_019576 [Characodon lateralis]|uniref:Uncharacterized protein n=1 Tax=Characodon lateralis TaxID=208331 RepID=A0ABU7F4C9_9TELE|nr:hypothetical protein [Characodon lateralis]
MFNDDHSHIHPSIVYQQVFLIRVLKGDGGLKISSNRWVRSRYSLHRSQQGNAATRRMNNRAHTHSSRPFFFKSIDLPFLDLGRTLDWEFIDRTHACTVQYTQNAERTWLGFKPRIVLLQSNSKDWSTRLQGCVHLSSTVSQC